MTESCAKRPKRAGFGRPPTYKPEFVPQAEKLCALGATDPDLATFFGVNPATIWRWKSAHEDFCKALTRGKEVADATVADRLFKRAVGYSHDAVKIFMPAGAEKPVYAPYVEHFPPDTTACIFWLKNRRPDLWRDKTEVEGEIGVRVAIRRIEAAAGDNPAVQLESPRVSDTTLGRAGKWPIPLC